MCCNSSANLGKKILDKDGNKKDAPAQGNQTEIALLRFCGTCDVPYRKLRADYIPEGGIRYPFSSTRKRMSTQINYKGEDFLLIKGASEYILGSCSSIHYWDTDEIASMTEALKAEIKGAIHGMAKKTLRTLCLAYKKIDGG